MKKALLAVGVLICLLIAGDKIYEFWKSHQPPFAVGECFLVPNTPLGDVKFKVIANDNAKTETQAVGTVEYLPGMEIRIPVKASYEEIRGSGVKKVDCQ